MIRARIRSLALALVGLASLALSACKGFDAMPPAGFAAFSDRTQFRAVSSDGVTYRVRREKNEPAAELGFWREALKKRMRDAGYVFVGDAEVKAGTQPGYYLELAAPMGAKDYSYAVAVFTQDSHIVLAESAGEVTRFRAHKQEILDAIAKLRL